MRSSGSALVLIAAAFSGRVLAQDEFIAYIWDGGNADCIGDGYYNLDLPDYCLTKSVAAGTGSFMMIAGGTLTGYTEAHCQGNIVFSHSQIDQCVPIEGNVASFKATP